MTGNLRCNAPNLFDLACLNDLTVSYIVDGTPTDVLQLVNNNKNNW
jgi:hypothetical protein